MCTDTTKQETPELSEVSITFDFVEATTHFRAGVVTHQNISYLGAFRQPGDRGKYFLVESDFSGTPTEASDVLQSQSDGSRNIYMGTQDGTRIDFDTSNKNDQNFISALGAANSNQTEDVVDWVRSSRFGLASTGISKQKLGAIVSSTSAVIGEPGLPVYFDHLSAADKLLINDFIAEHQDRPIVSMVGAKDGMLHGFRAVPNDTDDPLHGSEAWAYIPSYIAQNLSSDHASDNPRSYPDGSPTVSDIIVGQGNNREVKTVAIVASGHGGRGIMALDITETIDVTTGAVLGPQPMWEVSPQNGKMPDAGFSFTKPVIGRAEIDGVEKFIAVMGTGQDNTSPSTEISKGRTVVGIDIEDGSLLWRAQAACPLTSDVMVYSEQIGSRATSGPEQEDGFINFAVFADECGYMYRINPAQDLRPSGAHTPDQVGWIDTSEDFDVAADALSLIHI